MRAVLAGLLGLLIPATAARAQALAPAERSGGNDDTFLMSTAARAASRVNVTKTLDSSGGTLRGGRATVVVPAGAFSQPTVVILRSTASGRQYGPAAANAAYQVEILAPCHPAPIAVSLGGFGAPDRQVLIALADSDADGAGNNSSAPPTLIPAQVQGGAASFQLPAVPCGQAPGQAQAGGSSGVAAVATSTSHVFYSPATSGNPIAQTSSAHFMVNVPQSAETACPGLGGALSQYAETAYGLLKGMGFVFDTALALPMTINVAYGMDPQRYGELVLPLAGKDSQYININADKCVPANLGALKATLGHEFFHAVQNVYDPRSALLIRHTWSTPYFLWLAEASSTWFESRMMNSASYVSQVFLDNVNLMARGPEAYSTHKEAQDRGYWMSGFLRRLVDWRASDALVLDLWTTVKAQGSGSSSYNGMAALIAAVGDAAATRDRWRIFQESFTTGTTGYAGWPLPGSNKTWYASSNQGEVSAAMEPFSGQRWTFLFDTVASSDPVRFNAPQNNPDITYILFKGASSTGPFQSLGAVTFQKPISVNPQVGDLYVVAVANASLASPYKAASSALLRVGDYRKCVYCPDVPDSARVDFDGVSKYRWYDASNKLLAMEDYYTTTGKPRGVACYNVQTGGCIVAWEWANNGQMVWEYNYNDQCQRNGPTTGWFSNGNYNVRENWTNGLRTGPIFSYNYNGLLVMSGNYTAGQMDGRFTYYDVTTGEFWYWCDYSMGLNVGCSY